MEEIRAEGQDGGRSVKRSLDVFLNVVGITMGLTHSTRIKSMIVSG